MHRLMLPCCPIDIRLRSHMWIRMVMSASHAHLTMMLGRVVLLVLRVPMLLRVLMRHLGVRRLLHLWPCHSSLWWVDESLGHRVVHSRALVHLIWHILLVLLVLIIGLLLWLMVRLWMLPVVPLHAHMRVALLVILVVHFVLTGLVLIRNYNFDKY